MCGRAIPPDSGSRFRLSRSRRIRRRRAPIARQHGDDVDPAFPSRDQASCVCHAARRERPDPTHPHAGCARGVARLDGGEVNEARITFESRNSPSVSLATPSVSPRSRMARLPRPRWGVRDGLPGACLIPGPCHAEAHKSPTTWLETMRAVDAVVPRPRHSSSPRLAQRQQPCDRVAAHAEAAGDGRPGLALPRNSRRTSAHSST